MNDVEFRERVLSWMERTDNWMERTDNWMERTDNWMERTDNWIERTDEWKNKTDDQFKDIQSYLGELHNGLSWIRGKLEGKQESDAALWGKIAVLAAVGSAIIALLAYFK